MRILIILAALSWVGTTDVSAQNLPEHCRGDRDYAAKLRQKGPVIAVGASGSSGLLATPFPLLVARQMCLDEGDGFESSYSVFFFGSKLGFLKRMYIEQRPKIVIAIDHLHHSSKSKRFDAGTRAYLDRELARIALDCSHEIVDCSAQGEFHFVKQENYRPTVLLGDIYAFYAVDCSRTDPYKNDGNRKGVEKRNKGCIRDYIEINRYIRQKAREIPNLHIFPVSSLFTHVHRGLPYLYDLDGRPANFYEEDIFWDGFHPWSEPGAQLIANTILAELNRLPADDAVPGSVAIPYIPIADEYYAPFTGIVLINDSDADIAPGGNRRFYSEQGEEFRFSFDAESRSFRDQHGDWGYPEVFAKTTRSLLKRVGENPLVLKIRKLTANGDIVLSDGQIALINRIFASPDNRLLGGVITVTR